MNTFESLTAENAILRQQLEQSNSEKLLYQQKWEAMKELPQLNAPLHALAQKFPHALLLEDKNRKFVLANEQFCHLFGITSSPTELVGLDGTQYFEEIKGVFLYEEDFVTRINSVLSERESVHTEQLSMKDGRVLLQNYIPVHDTKGNHVGQYWIFQEISERRITKESSSQTLHELDKQKDFYEGILNSIPSDIAAFSPDHKYLFVNPVGIQNPEIRKWILGKTDYEYCELRNRPIEIAHNRRERFNIVKESGNQLEWEEQLMDQNGNLSYFLRKLYPVKNQDGSLKMVLGYGMNITERKLVEEELKKSEELYRLVIEATNDGIWDWDMRTNHVFFNKRLQQMFGYQEGEFTTSVDMWRKLMHPEDLPVAQAIVKDYLENGSPFFYKLRFFHKNGDIKWIMCRGFAIRDEKGNPYRMLGSYIDVTDVKETEEILKTAKETAEETTRAKEIFFANMSHEIRTPLNGIIGLSSLLTKTVLNNKQSEYLKAIKYSADNLLVIINDILDLAKIEAGKMELETIDFDIVEIAQNALKSLTYKAEEKGIHLSGTFAKDRIGVSGDPFRLTQVLTNLLNNAIKFTQNGNVELCVTKQRNEGIVEAQFEVKDTGIGIHWSKIDSIFNSFTQAQSDTTRKYGGTGLGLAICKNLVEMQGGRIEVESDFGSGSIFRFIIPYKSEVLEGSASTFEQKSMSLNKLEDIKLLLAEDNEINQFLACELIKSWGMEIDTAENGMEAISKWESNDYDLILMDIQMPELGGVEATIEIRNRGGKKSNIPIIALTANALKGQKERFLALGMDDYVTKPFDEIELYNKIVALLPEKRRSNIPKEKPIKKELFDYTNLQMISNGNKDFERKLLGVFVDTVPDSLLRLRKSCEQKNKETIGLIAHKLKTTIHAIGITQLKDTIQLLEDKATANEDMYSIIKLTDEVIDTLNEIVEEFKNRIS